MTLFRLLAIFCITLLTACAASRNTPSAGASTCAQVNNIAFSKDGTQYVNPVAAIELLSACYTQSQNSPVSYQAVLLKMRSGAYEQLNDNASAIADSEISLRLRPARTAWDVIPLAALYRKTGQPERSLTLLRKMFDDHLGVSGKGTSPGMPSYYHLGLTLIALNKWQEAAEAFTEGLTYQPDYAWAYFYRGLAYNGNNDTEHARADVRKGKMLFESSSDDSRIVMQQLLSKAPFPALLAKYLE